MPLQCAPIISDGGGKLDPMQATTRVRRTMRSARLPGQWSIFKRYTRQGEVVPVVVIQIPVEGDRVGPYKSHRA